MTDIQELLSTNLEGDSPWTPSMGGRDALSKLVTRKGGEGAEGAILPSVGHLQLISTLNIGADCCQLCQYKLTKPNLT